MRLNPSPRLVRGCFFAVLLIVGTVQAAPYRPASESEVLERLPPGERNSVLGALQQRSRSPELAARLARAHIERYRSQSDPRYLGYAQAVLQPWWEQAQPPPEVLLMRATLRQSRHDFEGALQDLAQLLRQQPQNAQAWLTQATVQRVLGRYAQAQASCGRLQGLTAVFVVELCQLSIAGLQGQLGPAYQALLELQPSASVQALALQSWRLAELADMAERLGRPAAAEAHYRVGLELGEDHGLRAGLADLLLDQGRARETATLTAGYETVDALSLRRALALKALGDAGFAALDRQILDGHANARRRGEDLHLREEARYVLDAQADAVAALPLAQANWKLQREPVDARLLLRAARGAAQPAAAQPVRDWMQASGIEDARLVADLKALAP